MVTKVSKKHGMSSEKASRVKTRGNRKEDIFARLIRGMVFRGTQKSDVINPYRQLFSIKGSSEKKGGAGKDGRIQMFQYRRSRFEIKEKDFPASNIITKIFDCYPDNYEDYQNNKQQVKSKVAICMENLKDFLLDETNKRRFLDRAIFSTNVDFFVIYDDDIFHIFDKDDVLNTFVKNLEVDNNSTKQKVVLKYGKICMEIEMRTTNDGKYPTIFIPSTKSVLIKILTETIKKQKKFDTMIWLYGNAIKEYKHHVPKI